MINSFLGSSKDNDSFATIGKLPRFDDPFADISPDIFDNFLPVEASQMISFG